MRLLGALLSDDTIETWGTHATMLPLPTPARHENDERHHLVAAEYNLGPPRPEMSRRRIRAMRLERQGGRGLAAQSWAIYSRPSWKWSAMARDDLDMIDSIRFDSIGAGVASAVLVHR